MKYLCIVFLLAMPFLANCPAFAAENAAVNAGAGEITDNLKNTKAKFVKYNPEAHLNELLKSGKEVSDKALKVAKKMFWFLAGFTLLYVVGQEMVFNGTRELSGFLAPLIRWIIVTGIFFHFLEHSSEYATGALDWVMANAEKAAGGTPGQINFYWFLKTGLAIICDSLTASFAPLGEITFSLKSIADGLISLVFAILTAGIMIILGLVNLAFFVAMGVKYALVKIMGYLVLYFGVLCLGLSGHPSGREFLISYYKKAIGIMLQLFTMCAFAVMIETYLKNALQMQMNDGDLMLAETASNIASALCMSVVLYLIYKIFDTIPGEVAKLADAGGGMPSNVNAGGAGVAAMGMAATGGAAAVGGAVGGIAGSFAANGGGKGQGVGANVMAALKTAATAPITGMVGGAKGLFNSARGGIKNLKQGATSMLKSMGMTAGSETGNILGDVRKAGFAETARQEKENANQASKEASDAAKSASSGGQSGGGSSSGGNPSANQVEQGLEQGTQPSGMQSGGMDSGAGRAGGSRLSNAPRNESAPSPDDVPPPIDK